MYEYNKMEIRVGNGVSEDLEREVSRVCINFVKIYHCIASRIGRGEKCLPYGLMYDYLHLMATNKNELWRAFKSQKAYYSITRHRAYTVNVNVT